MKRFKKNRFKINKNMVLIVSIFVLTGLFLSYISNNITPKLLDISTYSLDTYNNHLIMNFISNETLSNKELNDLINIVKNKDDEIISVDYDVKKSYLLLQNITNELYEIVSKTTYKDITDHDFDIKDDLVLHYPIGLAFNSIYFNNLGPKVPVKIKFLSSLVTNINTKVSNYGINNVLVEMYVDIEIEDYIVIPFKKESIKKHYNVLLASKVIMGKVPMYLGGTIENSSPMLQKK